MSDKEDMQKFLAGWLADPAMARPAFELYKDILAAQPDVSTGFKARPGVSYSLRARHAAQKRRELFVLVDVVDDEPENRWLSVCFYADLVSDPDEKGDVVPQGLSGEDAICFNLDENDPDMRDYIAQRIREAARNASKGD